MNVTETWLHVLTKDEIAVACSEADYPALPTRALKDQWVAHASGHVSLHHLSNDSLEKLCKKEHLNVYKGKPKAQLIKLLQGTPVDSAVQPDISAAFSNMKIKPSLEVSLVSPQRLDALVPQRLQDLCHARVLPAHGSKADLIQSLRQDSVSLEELSKSELKALCAAEGLPVSGMRTALISRLQGSCIDRPHIAPSEQHVAQRQQVAHEEAVIQQGELQQAGKKMSRNQYANILRREGLLEADQDVFHIIASANGGADHTHNYHFAQNQSWNRAIGSQHDFINCYIAGKIKAEKAVAISRSIGNGTVKYSGPDALTLYKMGEDIMRTMRREHRHDWVNLMQARA